MERLTNKNLRKEMENTVIIEVPWAVSAWVRLADIEDYDLDRLKEQKTQTNADKIRSMTDEELYDFLCSFASRYTDISSPCAFRAKLFYVMGWLKQPPKEE